MALGMQSNDLISIDVLERGDCNTPPGDCSKESQHSPPAATATFLKERSNSLASSPVIPFNPLIDSASIALVANSPFVIESNSRKGSPVQDIVQSKGSRWDRNVTESDAKHENHTHSIAACKEAEGAQHSAGGHANPAAVAGKDDLSENHTAYKESELVNSAGLSEKDAGDKNHTQSVETYEGTEVAAEHANSAEAAEKHAQGEVSVTAVKEADPSAGHENPAGSAEQNDTSTTFTQQSINSSSSSSVPSQNHDHTFPYGATCSLEKEPDISGEPDLQSRESNIGTDKVNQDSLSQNCGDHLPNDAFDSQGESVPINLLGQAVDAARLQPETPTRAPKPAIRQVILSSGVNLARTTTPRETDFIPANDTAKRAPLQRQISILNTVLSVTQTPTMELPKIKTDDVPNGSSAKDVLFDPWCDPANPRQIQFQDISAAAFKIKTGIMNTPCTRSHLSNITETQLFFKKDFLQYTGSFKERGARYTLLMLPEEEKKKGVITASAGNHALGLSYHGQDLNIPVTVVMPIVAPIMKVQSCRQYGAQIIIHGRDIGESREHAMRIAKDKGLTYINGYDHPHIIAGQGTMGLEIVEQVKNIDAVVIPVGGGGLIAGVALAIKSLYPNVKVISAESERCSSFSNAMKAGEPIYTKADTTLADGLAVPKVGINALATARSLVDKCVVVKEEFIAMAILRLVEIEKAVVEGAGAVGLAALLAGLLPELKGKRVVIPLCGGNIDTTVLGRCLERGLAVDGRLVKFSVTVSDRPGGIAELCRLMANLGVSIKDILHERAWLKSDIFSVEVRVMCETRDLEHAIELERVLKENYTSVHFGHMCDALGGGGLKVDILDSRSPLL